MDSERTITYWNRGAERITGYAASEITGRHCYDNLLVHVGDDGEVLCQTGCPLQATISDGRPREAEVYLRHKQGHRVPVHVRAAPMRDDGGRIVGAVETFSDQSALAGLAQRVEELERLSMADPLTRVGNRRFAEMTLYSKLSEMERGYSTFGVIFIDIDDFRAVNDNFGHDAGDWVLRMIARTLSGSSRPYDLVARWGGEEFLAVISNMTEEGLRLVASKYRALVERSGFRSPAGEVRVTVSLGGTLACRGDTVETLVRRADRLMYRSKAGGKNMVSIECPGGAAPPA